MVFCGQCGSPIAPGSTRCPNCGAVSDIPAEVTAQDIDETLHVDDPTIESRTLGSAIQGQGVYPAYPVHTTPSPYPTQQNGSFTPPEQHKLILHSNGTYDYDAQGASEATSEMRPSPYGTYPSSPRPTSAPSSPYNTVAEQANYPNAAYLPTQAAPNYQSNPGPVSNYGNYNPYLQQYPQGQQTAQPMQPGRQRRGRVPVLLAVLLLLVLVLGGLVAYALRHAQVANNSGNTGGGTPQTTTVPVTPSDHAKAVVQQYYNDINNKNYHDAYYLWERNGGGQSYASFVHGYTHTVSDALTISNIVESGGTVKVEMNIVATERNGNRTTQHTYGGYYVVGQVNGTWKILRGYLVQVR